MEDYCPHCERKLVSKKIHTCNFCDKYFCCITCLMQHSYLHSKTGSNSLIIYEESLSNKEILQILLEKGRPKAKQSNFLLFVKEYLLIIIYMTKNMTLKIFQKFMKVLCQ